MEELIIWKQISLFGRTIGYLANKECVSFANTSTAQHIRCNCTSKHQDLPIDRLFSSKSDRILSNRISILIVWPEVSQQLPSFLHGGMTFSVSSCTCMYKWPFESYSITSVPAYTRAHLSLIFSDTVGSCTLTSLGV